MKNKVSKYYIARTDKLALKLRRISNRLRYIKKILYL